MLSFLKFSVPHLWLRSCDNNSVQFPSDSGSVNVSARVFQDQYQIFLWRNKTTFFLSMGNFMTWVEFSELTQWFRGKISFWKITASSRSPKLHAMCLRGLSVQVPVSVLLAGADAGTVTITIWAGGRPYNKTGLDLENSAS